MTRVETPPSIRIRGARTHNLQNVSIDLPLGKLIVMTGVSGSGKSSLAFDTLFAEGQRRYLESVSVHTRTLLKQLPRPEVDEVSGLPPTVCVDQRVTTAPARSTLAITTDIYDYLRLLFARAGTAHCTECGKSVKRQSVDQIVERLLRLPERSKLMVLSPMVRAQTCGQTCPLKFTAGKTSRGTIKGEIPNSGLLQTFQPSLNVRKSLCCNQGGFV